MTFDEAVAAYSKSAGENAPQPDRDKSHYEAWSEGRWRLAHSSGILIADIYSDGRQEIFREVFKDARAAESTGLPSPTVLWIAGIVFVTLAFYGWASGGWERGYARKREESRQRYQRSKERVKAINQMSDEEYYRRRAWEDAPSGQTRGGDTY